ncbi:MAG: peptidylprolyl isomerase [Ruminococcus sp.]|nr:peptidylprolyl isomerase [Ruminococcus sp.]
MKRDEPYVDKGNNSTMGTPYARKRMMTYFQFSMIAVVFVLVFAAIYLISSSGSESVDYSDAELIQYELPEDDAPVVVYETNYGTFKAVLFPDEAPEYCEYFISLVESGYYDGTYVFAVQDSVYFMGGSKTSDGTDDDETNTDECDAEKSKDLWPFYGAIAAYGNQKSAFNSQIQAGSRALFIGTIEFDEETVSQLDSASDNTTLNEAFKQKGGVPNFSQQYTIFAQVYDGFDAYDEVMSADVVQPAEDDEDDDADLRPKEELVFEKVYMSTYGENRNDEFFTLDDISAVTQDSLSSESE